MREPANVVYLAAELASHERHCIPAAAATVATELCRLGRRFKRISENLCAGEDEWGPWSDNVAKLQERARKQLGAIETQCNEKLHSFPDSFIYRSGLLLMCRSGSYATALL